ncbi:unnamed protein product [Peniophora sp. CBMAI 1063]|nr:unnamed protein product [Peniophora sp. CBMAI 1063]
MEVAEKSTWIHRLPTELLIDIFLRVHDMTGANDTHNHLRGPPACAFLSYVCRRWRTVAISCQQLWASFPRSNQHWTRTCIERAHSCPVELRFDVWRPLPGLRDMQTLAFSAIQRATTVTIYGEMDRYKEGRRDMAWVLRGLATHETPLLEELRITLDQDGWDPYQPISLPGIFNDKPPPNLRNVDLDGCLLRPPHAISAPSLTRLYLNSSCIWSGADDMIQFFRLVPQLESFEFVYPGNDDHGFSTQPSRTHSLRCVSLPDLDEFNVEASFDAGLIMFSYIAFSPDAHLTLIPSDGESPLDRYTEDELGSLIARASTAVRAHFAKDIEEDICYPSVVIGSARISAMRLLLGIPFYLNDFPQLRAAAGAMYATIPVFANTSSLTLEGNMEGFTMRDLLCFKHVERLRLKGAAPVILEAALREHDSFMDEIFPQREEIVIRGFDFVRWPGTLYYGCPVPEDFARRLADALYGWCQETEHVVDVKFVGCLFLPDQEALFKEKFGPGCTRVG